MHATNIIYKWAYYILILRIIITWWCALTANKTINMYSVVILLIIVLVPTAIPHGLHAMQCLGRTVWQVKKNCSNEAVQFGRYIPSFTPQGSNNGFTIISREISTVCLRLRPTLPQFSYTLITANSPDCGPHSAPIHLQYRVNNSDWMTLSPRKSVTSALPLYVLWFLFFCGDVIIIFPRKWIRTWLHNKSHGTYPNDDIHHWSGSEVDGQFGQYWI